MADDWYPQADKVETTKKWDGTLGLGAVVMHIAQGSYAAAVKWLSDDKLNPNSSSHFVLAKDGRLAQLVSVNNSAWANGLHWTEDASLPEGGYWKNPRGVQVNPSWQDLNPGKNPNLYTISVEHEGMYQDAWTPEMSEANQELLVWLAEQFELWWVPYRNLIGHYAIDPVDRPNCPGPTVDLEKMAADANTVRILNKVVKHELKAHVHGTTALLSLPTRKVITQLRDIDVDIYGHIDFDDRRWLITPFSYNNRQPYFFEAAATSSTPAIFPSLALNPGYRDTVTPSASELRELKPRWVRVMLFKQYQDFATGRNTELDWLIDRVRSADSAIQILVLATAETFDQTPPKSGTPEFLSFVARVSDLAGKVSSYYRGKIGALQVWNEPDLQKMMPEDYAALLKSAYAQVKAANPDLPVISAGTCCGENFDYARRVVTVAPDAFDYAGWHAYAERADGYPFPGWGFGELRASLNTARAIAGKPLWVTEIGAKLDWNWGSIPPEQGVAEYMKRALAIINDLGQNQVSQACWFTWRIPEGEWGIVDDLYNKRPAWFAFRELSKGLIPAPSGQVEITNVSISPTTLAAGQVVEVSVTLRNGTTTALPTQAPAPGFTYNEGDTFLTRGYPEVNGAYRVGIDFQSRTGIDHPYRWGLGSPLPPGESRVIKGTIRLNKAQSKGYWAGLVREQIAWLKDNLGTTQITVQSPTTPPPTGRATILSATFAPSTLPSGQLLNVSVTVRNDTNVPLATQPPAPGFTYLEGETFLSHGQVEQRDAFRIGVDFQGRVGIDHPYRWGIGAPLAPGETRVVNGFIRLNKPKAVEYWAGLVREQVVWIEDQKGVTRITVSGGTPPPFPPPSPVSPVVTSVEFIPTQLDKGQIMRVKVTLRNDSSQPLVTQSPGTGFLYNEGDNYLTKGMPPVSGAWRVGVDYSGRQGLAFPYRWGFTETLAPGRSAIVVGFLRLNRRQSVDYWVGLIKEENQVVSDRLGIARITVERG